jgi:hypothetical protein
MPLSREGLKRNSARSDTHQWRPGDNLIRVLPPTKDYFTKDINNFDIKFFVHYNLGPEGSPPVTCPRTFDDKAPCPACAMARRLWRSESTKDLARSINRKVRFVMNILDIEQPNGVEIAEIGTKIHDPIVQAALDPDSGDILDITQGRNFRVHLTPPSKETAGFPQYTTTASMKASSVKDILSKTAGWADQLDNLKAKINPAPPVEEIEKMVRAVVGDTSAGEVRAQPPTDAKVTKIGEDEFPDSGPADSVVKPGSTGSARDEFSEDKGEAPPTQPAAEKVEETPPPPPPPNTGDKDPCFGKEFQPGQERCKGCRDKEPCMEEFTK